MALAPGRPYFSAEPPAAHVRLSFAAVAGAAEIAEGVRRLRAAGDEVLRGTGVRPDRAQPGATVQ
ncbi:hypothetical protein GCM10020295_67850 [Streptomyces cinereospinus]